MRTTFLTTPVSRRAALRAAGGAVLGTTALTLVTGCSESGGADTPAEVDALTEQARSARRDAANATATIAARPDLAAALGVIAAERTAHGDALDEEIARAASTPSSTTATTPAAAPVDIDQLRADLASAQRDAGTLARTQTGYRAGLLGSISASCAAQQVVLLP
ncbi:hypothetical protein ACFTSD_16170 [Nocardiaceae bacterium NPDC056970]